MAENQNPHQGHRGRLKEQFKKSGLDSFHDVNALELLLFYAVPRTDTNPIAHHLIDTFGSLSAVFEAPVWDLVKKGGLTENAALLIKLVPAIDRRQLVDRAQKGAILNTLQECGAYMLPWFSGETEEAAYLMGMDAKCKVLDCVLLGRGEVNSVALNPRRVVEQAISMKATTVVLAHNHPSGIATPSGEDIYATERIGEALNLIGVMLLDHVIVCGDDYVSMRESGMLSREGL